MYSANGPHQCFRSGVHWLLARARTSVVWRLEKFRLPKPSGVSEDGGNVTEEGGMRCRREERECRCAREKFESRRDTRVRFVTLLQVIQTEHTLECAGMEVASFTRRRQRPWYRLGCCLVLLTAQPLWRPGCARGDRRRLRAWEAAAGGAWAVPVRARRRLQACGSAPAA